MISLNNSGKFGNEKSTNLNEPKQVPNVNVPNRIGSGKKMLRKFAACVFMCLNIGEKKKYEKNKFYDKSECCKNEQHPRNPINIRHLK